MYIPNYQMTTIGGPTQSPKEAPATLGPSSTKKKRGGAILDIGGVAFTVIKKLGKGAYGTVERVEDAEGNPYAVKRVEQKKHDGCYADILKEMDILRRFGEHPNIIKLYGYAWREHPHEFLVLMEYGGTPLHRYISNVEYNERKALFPMVLWQILSGLAYLHTNGIAHRDVKPDNILIEEFEESDGQITPYLRLCDFGLSKNMALKRNTPKTSTLWYRAPENLQKLDTYSYKIDVWAVGCIVYEYMTGRVLFESNTTGQTLLQIISGLGPLSNETYAKLRIDKSRLPKKYRKYTLRPLEDDVTERLMLQMLTVDPDARPNASDLLRNEYFTNQHSALVARANVFIQEESVRRKEMNDSETVSYPPLECPSFTPDIRRALIGWLFEIYQADQDDDDRRDPAMRPETLMMGIALFDDVMSKWGTLQSDGDLKYITLSCLNIASKYLELGLDVEFIYTWNYRQFHKSQGVPSSRIRDPSTREVDEYINTLNAYEQRCLMLLDFRIGGRHTLLDKHRGDFNKAKKELLK